MGKGRAIDGTAGPRALRAGGATGAVLMAAFLAPPGAAAPQAAPPPAPQAAPPSAPPSAPPPAPLPPPAVPPLGPEPEAAPGQVPNQVPGQVPGQAPGQPVGPVGPARTFEPVAPLPGGLVDTRPGGPAGPVQAARPAPSGLTRDPGGAGLDPAFVPGATEAGLVVADPARLLGADALPAFGTAVAAAAGLAVGLRFAAEYDDNVARTALASPPPGSRFSSKDDFVLRPALNLSAGRPLGPNLLFLNASLGRDFFLRNENIDRARTNVVGGFSWRSFTGCSGRVQGGWNTRETNRDEFEIQVPGSTTNTSFFTSATCELPSRLVPSVSFDVIETRFTPDRRALFDNNGWGVSAALGYAMGRDGQVGIQYAYRRGVFPNQPLPPELFPPGDPPEPGQVSTVSTQTIGGFLVYRFSPQLFANLSLGYTTTDRGIPGIPEFAGVTGTATIAYTERRFGATASLGRATNIGRFGGNTLQVTETFALQADYRLLPRMRANAGFNLLRFVGDEFEPIGGPGLPRRGNDQRRIGFGFDVDLQERLLLSADYSNRRRLVDELRPGFTANQVTIGIRWNVFDSRRGFGF